MLRTEDQVDFKGSLGQFLKGLGWCAAAGFLISTVLWMAVGSERIGWTGWFGIYWVLLIAVLVVQSRRHKEKGYTVRSLEDASDHHEDTPGGQAAGDLELRAPFFAQVLSWGPRAMVDGFAGLRGKHNHRQRAIFKRAAQILSRLAKFSSGIPIRALIQPPENIPIFAAALDLLDTHDYAGRSSDGERIWITTHGRKKLAEHHIHIKIDEV